MKMAVIRDEQGHEVLRFPVSDTATDEQIVEAAKLLMEQAPQKVPQADPEDPRVRCIQCEYRVDNVVRQADLWQHIKEEHDGV